MTRHKTSYSVNPKALELASARAKNELDLPLSRVVSIMVRQMLAKGITLDSQALQLFGPRSQQLSMSYSDDDWKDAEGRFYPGYAEPKNRAPVFSMLVNLYAAGQAHVRFDVVLSAGGDQGLT
ncbi:hypothetical protein [Planomonospora venezuelensis]|uniref:Uncharacterized protein n=1 Tax=Planomonospora venezuelensis TaxID=1999 RepID=A0A841CU46_PLAVE|nr:hypothetical protein [Planomonospora venezuelensis]MBB5960850.1 hypothetical protein [Planomonospora venezuelensis]GIN01084.1 hypothetical protein Pve01_27420 [Planomonospora venezuelensis]